MSDRARTRVKTQGRFELRVAGCLTILLLGSTSLRANMGFRLMFSFPPSPGAANLHWVSLPYFYAHTTAEGVCADFGGAVDVAMVRRWDEASGRFVSHQCGAPGPFAIQKGVAYGIVNAPLRGVEDPVMGSHDDSFVLVVPPTLRSNLTWISIPYHVRLPDRPGTPAGADAEDLCASIGSSEVRAILRWDDAAGAFVTYACGSTIETPFQLKLGEGYGVVNQAGQTISWLAPHY